VDFLHCRSGVAAPGRFFIDSFVLLLSYGRSLFLDPLTAERTMTATDKGPARSYVQSRPESFASGASEDVLGLV
jgi:hypothetical protein